MARQSNLAAYNLPGGILAMMRAGRILPLLVALTGCASVQTPPANPSTTSGGGGDQYWINFVPFGAGQFQNNDKTKGVALAIAEGAAAATSLGIWVYLTRHYRGEFVPVDDASRVRLLQRIEIGAGWAFFGLYALGVVDSLVHYKPRVNVRGTNVSISPVLEPGTGGVALSWSH